MSSDPVEVMGEVLRREREFEVSVDHLDDGTVTLALTEDGKGRVVELTPDEARAAARALLEHADAAERCLRGGS